MQKNAFNFKDQEMPRMYVRDNRFSCFHSDNPAGCSRVMSTHPGMHHDLPPFVSSQKKQMEFQLLSLFIASGGKGNRGAPFNAEQQASAKWAWDLCMTSIQGQLNVDSTVSAHDGALGMINQAVLKMVKDLNSFLGIIAMPAAARDFKGRKCEEIQRIMSHGCANILATATIDKQKVCIFRSQLSGGCFPLTLAYHGIIGLN